MSQPPPDHRQRPLAAPAEEGSSAGGMSTSVVSASDSFGSYQLLREIARGGMGVVWEARHTLTNRHVALKMLRGQAARDPAEKARFRAEAEIIAALDHPGIVPVFDVGELRGRSYFAMKLLTGGSLKDQIESLRSTPHIVGRLVREIAEALSHAHARGILHRDIKPSNILLDGEGRPLLTDFGLAKKTGLNSTKDNLTKSGEVLGTPHYMAPEQARGRNEDLTTAVDIWSLGAVMYQCLTGKMPFEAESEVAVIWKLMSDDPTPPRKLNSAVDRDLEAICLKCLSKEPNARYESAEALIADLDRWAAGEALKMRPPNQLERLTAWIKRRPATLAASVLITVLLIIQLTFAARVMDSSRVHRAHLERLENLQSRMRDAEPALERLEADARKLRGKLQDARDRLPKDQAELAQRQASLDALRDQYRQEIEILKQEGKLP